MTSIFIGGIKPALRASFEQLYQGVNFHFALEDESPATWKRAAVKAQHHIVFQHRTTHRHIQFMQGAGVKPHFTDSVPVAHKLIVEILKNGKASHHYNGIV